MFTMKRIILIAFCFLLTAVPVFSQSSFEKKKAEARAAASRGDYVSAVRTIEQIRNLPSLTDAQEKEVESLYREYRRERDRLELSANALSFSPMKNSDSVVIRAGQHRRLNYSIAESDSWIKASIDKEKGKLFINVDSNPRKEARTGIVTVSMGAIKTQLTVTQSRRPDVTRLVRVSASPAYAQVTVENERHGLPSVFSLSGGRNYVFHIEKKDYHSLDTTIFIPDDQPSANDTIALDVKLVPEFAKVRVNWAIPEDCAIDTSKIKLQINRVLIDNYVTGYMRVYDSDARVRNYTLYEDGTIPVSSGGYIDISLEAPGFKPAEFKGPELSDGEIKDVQIDLVPLKGRLSIMGNNYLGDATILIDGREIGTISEEQNTFSVQVGQHVVSARNPGFRTFPNSSYDIEIHQDKLTSLNISMIPDVRMVYESNPAGATVTIDGKELSFKTPTPSLPINPGMHEVVITMDGYMPMRQTLLKHFTHSYTDTLEFSLLPAKTIHITADKENVFMDILGKQDNASLRDSVFIKDVSLPTDVTLHPRKSPYRVRLYEHKPDGSRKNIYSDNLYFKPDGIDRKDYTIWPKDKCDLQFIGGDWILAPTNNGIAVGTASAEGVTNSLRPALSAYILKFGFNKCGLSWSVLKARHFMFSGSTPTQYKTILNGIPAITFLNLEWRGGISFVNKWFQANALVSYAYYPDLLKNILPASHITGHEIFLGGEFSIATGWFTTINIKAGLQMYKGLEANLLVPEIENSSKQWQTVPLNYPNAFVVSVGINLFQLGRGNPALRFGTF